MVCMANCMVMVAAIVAEDLEGDQSEDNNEAGLHLVEELSTRQGSTAGPGSLQRNIRQNL